MGDRESWFLTSLGNGNGYYGLENDGARPHCAKCFEPLADCGWLTIERERTYTTERTRLVRERALWRYYDYISINKVIQQA